MPEPVLLHVQYRFCGARMLQPEFSTFHYRFWGISYRFSKIGNEPIPVLVAAKIDNEIRNSIGNEPIPVLDAAKIGNVRLAC